MNKNPLISVIVPCYNVEKYVGQCIESILSQSYENIEVLVINDGATDNTEQMIKPFLKDDRIRYFFQKNAGLSEARNTGLRAMKGEYVCFVDSDDYIHQDYIKILFENLIKYDADISICDLIYDYDGKLKYHGEEEKQDEIVIHTKEECLDLINRDFRYVVAWNKLYNVSLFNNLFYKTGKIHEDEFIIHHIFWRTKKVVRIGKILYMYRQIENSIMNSTYTEDKFKNAIEAFDDRIAFYRKNNIPFVNKVHRIKWYIIYNKGIIILNSTMAKQYILNHPIEFFTKFKHPIKKKIKFYFKILLELIQKRG